MCSAWKEWSFGKTKIRFSAPTEKKLKVKNKYQLDVCT
ncbi:hypothetical protein LEP1GSC170_4014 [Leptospira interrogans serovar Bataviae str. HAI135]|nr:hypothetical protein LEP1GSC170_4014 [Leptospira interrogans serovar Bataviae str. HAI135]